MKNQEVASVFKKMADLLEIKGENPFRIRAYQRAAQNLESLAEDIAGVAARQGLEALPGIGKDLASKIREILETGTLQNYEDLKQEIPEGLREIIAVPGVGPRMARTLHDALKISSVDQLEQLAKEHRLQGIPGIQAKTEENILKGVALYRQKLSRTSLSTMLALSRQITSELRCLPEVRRISVAGSLRRQRETIKDIDILVTSLHPERVMDYFTSLPVVHEIQAKGSTKGSIRTREGIQVDLRVVEAKSFGAALCYFTGSKAHNIRIRELAVKKGLKVNEYGVFRGEELIGGVEEEDVFSSLGLPYIAPELREDRGEVEAALAGTLPRLVELKEVRGDLHVHSRYSDGAMSLEEIGVKAEALGLEWVAVCDHSPSLKIAGGVTPAMLIEKRKEVAAWNRKHPKVTLLCGAEVDITNDGSLDYSAEILAQLDFVIAAIHSGFKQDEKTITERIVKAMRHPLVHMIAHPTGRLIGEREAYAVDLEKIMDEAAKTKTMLEINAYPQRLDLSDIYCRTAKEKGVKIGIGTDAHIADQMEYLELGIAVARRGWLEKKDLVNTLSCRELRRYLKMRSH